MPKSNSTERSQLLNRSRNYVVTRHPDPLVTWNFQIYDGQIRRYAAQRPFHVVAVCDYETDHERVFSIPYDFLEAKVLPRAHRDHKGRYLFEVNKSSLTFNWRHSIDMNGRPFLLK